MVGERVVEFVLLRRVLVDVQRMDDSKVKGLVARRLAVKWRRKAAEGARSCLMYRREIASAVARTEANGH